MYSESILVTILVLVVGLYALYSAFASKLDVPGPGLRQYFPGGVVYPTYKDPRKFTTTYEVLSRKYGDVFQMRLGAAITVVTAVPEDIVHVFSSIDLFPRAPRLDAGFTAAVPDGLLSMERQLHKTTRKALRENFNYSLLENFHSNMTDAVIELCDIFTSYVKEQSKMDTPKVIDMSEEIATVTFQILMNVALGMGMSRQQRLDLAEKVDIFLEEMMNEFIGYPFRQALTPFGVRKQFMGHRDLIRRVCQDIVRKRLQESEDEKQGRHVDVLDGILKLKGIHSSTAASMTMEFVIAGSHTTYQALVWSILEICCNPHVQQRIDEELSSKVGNRPLSEAVTVEDLKKLTYFTCVWKETLRLHHIGAGMLREAKSDLTLRGSGTWVPKGTLILAHIARAQTHEKIWKDPLSFKPERWDSQSGDAEGDHLPRGCYVPFGAGPKACVGRFLADYEGPLVLIELYRRFRFQLACERDEIVCCSCFVDTAKTSSREDGPLDRGLPVVVSLK